MKIIARALIISLLVVGVNVVITTCVNIDSAEEGYV